MEIFLAVSTLVAAVAVAGATIWYVSLTHQLVSAAQSATRESLRALVSVEPERRGDLLLLRIRNAGQRPASGLTLRIVGADDSPASAEYVDGVCMTDIVRFFPKSLGPGEKVVRYWGNSETAKAVTEHDLIGLEMQFFDGFERRIERQTFAVSDFDGLVFPIELPVEFDDIRRIASALDEPCGLAGPPVRLVSLIAKIVNILEQRMPPRSDPPPQT